MTETTTNVDLDDNPTTVQYKVLGDPFGNQLGEAPPWLFEADKVQWYDQHTGLACLIVRHSRSGHWCGYVGVEADHDLYGVNYEDVWIDEFLPFEVNFSSACQEASEAGRGVCHVPEHGRSDEVWWLGFDMLQDGGLPPGGCKDPALRDQYRTQQDTVNKTTELAHILHANNG